MKIMFKFLFVLSILSFLLLNACNKSENNANNTANVDSKQGTDEIIQGNTDKDNEGIRYVTDGETESEMPVDVNAICNHIFGEWETVVGVSCQTDGILKRTCSACHAEDTTVVPKIEHIQVIDEVVLPTCVSTGLTEGSHCWSCNTVLVPQTVIPATGVHAMVTDPAKPATCNEAGLTDGTHCSICNTVFKKQETVPKTDHTYVKSIVKPTCSDEGYTLYKCSCGSNYRTNYVYPTYEHEVEKIRKFADGLFYPARVCKNCGVEVLYSGVSGQLNNDTVKYCITGEISESGEEGATSFANMHYKNIHLYVYGKGKILDARTHYPPDWHEHLSDISAITVADGITAIGYRGFYCPNGRTKVTFEMSDSVKVLEEKSICLNMDSLVLGDGVERVEKWAFENCTSVYLPKSIKYYPLENFGSVTVFYEGSASDFYNIKTNYYQKTISMKDFVKKFTGHDMWLLSYYKVFVNAENINDTHDELYIYGDVSNSRI